MYWHYKYVVLELKYHKGFDVSFGTNIEFVDFYVNLLYW